MQRWLEHANVRIPSGNVIGAECAAMKSPTIFDHASNLRFRADVREAPIAASVSEPAPPASATGRFAFFCQANRAIQREQRREEKYLATVRSDVHNSHNRRQPPHMFQRILKALRSVRSFSQNFRCSLLRLQCTDRATVPHDAQHLSPYPISVYLV